MEGQVTHSVGKVNSRGMRRSGISWTGNTTLARRV